MKRTLSVLSLCLLALGTKAQNVGINTVTPDATAALDIAAPGKGLLIPRMSTSVRTNITGAAKGLLVYDSTIKSFYFNDGASWLPVANAPTTDAAALTTGTLSDSRLSTAVTRQGNTFNGNSQLVQLNASGQLPALNGTNLTSLNAGSLVNTVAIANGGTGQTTAAGALNALLPAQANNSGKVLTTNGSTATWAAAGGGASLQLVATSNTAQTIPAGASNGTTTDLAFGNVITSPEAAVGTWNGTTFTTAATGAGLYLVTASFGGTANFIVSMQLNYDGAVIAYGSGLANGFFGTPPSRASLSMQVYMAAGKSLKVQAGNAGSTSTNTSTTDGTTRIVITKLN